MLLSDFNEEAETVNQFEMNDIIKELHSEEILLIAMYVELISLIFLSIIINDNN